jgi:CubicO group peptidase (beta-lactamase class C family)
MRIDLRIAAIALLAFQLSAASLPVAKPEEVGLSGERLQRIHEVIQRHIDDHQISGAVTLVARKGRVAHWEAHGAMDLESKKAMAKDSIFRIWSMSKPVGRGRHSHADGGRQSTAQRSSVEIHSGIQGMKVAVMQDRPAAPAGATQAALQFYTMPASREITVQDLLTHVSGLMSGGSCQCG